MKVFTLGTGFVADHLPYSIVEEHIYSPSDIDEVIRNIGRPDVLINCIGKTGRPNIDWCESHKEETAFANVALPIMLAERCKAHNIHLIQIASGCIYFGESPNSEMKLEKHYWSISGDKENNSFNVNRRVDLGWKENDFANPQSFYSKSKYACDLMLGQMDHVTSLRIRMPISTKDHPRNIINKLRGYSNVIDIPNSMTFMDDLTRCVNWVIQERCTGIFHVTNPQPITAARIMQEYQKYVPEHTFSSITEDELDQMTIAKRSNCILSTQKLNEVGFQMTNSEEALVRCMSEYVKNVRNNVK